MTGKITTAVVAVILFGTAGVASAQPIKHSVRTSGHLQAAHWQAPYSDSYYNRDYWQGGGRHANRLEQRDPYAGTYFENVAPY
jgi:hypothetical protein